MFYIFQVFMFELLYNKTLYKISKNKKHLKIQKLCFMNLKCLRANSYWFQRSLINHTEASEEWLMQKWLPINTLITSEYVGVRNERFKLEPVGI